MPYVEIYKLQNDGTQKVVAICRSAGDRAVCEGEKSLIASLELGGIYDYSVASRAKLYPKDGMKFLENLKFNFKSGYLNASEVLKDS